MRFANCAVAMTLVLALLAAEAFAAERQGPVLYRYRDNRGVLAIDDHVPPEFVKNGYQVVTRDGRVIEEVPPQLTGVAAEKARAEAAEVKRLQEWDESLLRRYSTVADIEAARTRALREFDIRISILNSNLQSIKGQIEREQARAADIERRGQQVPAELTATIDGLRTEIAVTEETVTQRKLERAEVHARFQRDIERFQSLKEIVDARRRGYGGSN